MFQKLCVLYGLYSKLHMSKWDESYEQRFLLIKLQSHFGKHTLVLENLTKLMQTKKDCSSLRPKFEQYIIIASGECVQGGIVRARVTCAYCHALDYDIVALWLVGWCMFRLFVASLLSCAIDHSFESYARYVRRA